MLNLFSRRETEKPKFAYDELELTCHSCKTAHKRSILAECHYICPKCGVYMRIPARDRIRMLADKNSFAEFDASVTSYDFLKFPGYREKLVKARETTGEVCAVTSGVMRIDGRACAVFVMDSRFIMASMGSAVGEKITRLFEYATNMQLPVLGVICSGGARMQEGIVSLMQMAKCSGAIRRHSDKHLLYIAMLTDPTTGGITASIAMEGDITIAEPRALVGFAGRRVIEQTTGTALPDNFQTAEFLLDHGFIDMVLPRQEQRATISLLLRQHERSMI